MQITIDGPLLSKWNASQAVTLWWKDKQQRQVADKRVTVTCMYIMQWFTMVESDHSSKDELDLED